MRRVPGLAESLLEHPIFAAVRRSPAGSYVRISSPLYSSSCTAPHRARICVWVLPRSGFKTDEVAGAARSFQATHPVARGGTLALVGGCSQQLTHDTIV